MPHLQIKDILQNCFLLFFFNFRNVWLAKPVTSHAISGPLCLTNPTPMEATLRSSAYHMHTPP